MIASEIEILAAQADALDAKAEAARTRAEELLASREELASQDEEAGNQRDQIQTELDAAEQQLEIAINELEAKGERNSKVSSMRLRTWQTNSTPRKSAITRHCTTSSSTATTNWKKRSTTYRPSGTIAAVGRFPPAAVPS
jgi:chromosome segregation ATPase